MTRLELLIAALEKHPEASVCDVIDMIRIGSEEERDDLLDQFEEYMLYRMNDHD